MGSASLGAVVTGEYLRVYSPRFPKHTTLSINSAFEHNNAHLDAWLAMNHQKMSDSCSISHWCADVSSFLVLTWTAEETSSYLYRLIFLDVALWQEVAETLSVDGV